MTRSLPATDASADPIDAVMTGLQAVVFEKLTQIVGAKSVAFCDYALHGNVGDLLIVAGANAFFRKAGIRVLTYDSVYSQKFDELAKLPKDVPIVCHGGGNFGDLYFAHQNFREQLAIRFPDRKIIVFPQSLHFSTPEALETSAAIFARHPNFHLCVRDHESIEMGLKFTPNVHLVPDCAHMLWGTLSAPQPGAGRLHFMRIDIESAVGATSGSLDWETMFPAEVYKRQAFRQTWTKKIGRLPTPLASRAAFALWMMEVRDMIADASRIFGAHETIETDRLHGMILSLLLSKKVVYHENAVKKLSRYSNAWLAGLQGNHVTPA